jgi:hypothetical protein
VFEILAVWLPCASSCQHRHGRTLNNGLERDQAARAVRASDDLMRHTNFRETETALPIVVVMAPMCRPQVQHQDQNLNPCNDFYIEDQAVALNAGLMEANSPLTSVAGRGGLNR